MLQTSLEHAGVPHILVATNGREALEVLKHEAADIELVVLDIHLPEVDGIQILRQLRETAIKSPVVLVSGNTVMMQMAEKLGRQYGLNIVAALSKPLTDRDIDCWFTKPDSGV